jgi:HTH-type transcriptional regulator/antitoxin HipB
MSQPSSPAHSFRGSIPYTGYIDFIPLGGYYDDIPYRRYVVDYVARTPAQLGPILRSIRTERGLTQKQAGAKVGLKQSTVSAVESESGHTSVDTLYKLLSSLGLELVVRDKTSDHGLAGVRKREW